MTHSLNQQPDSRSVATLVATHAGRAQIRLSDQEQALLAHAYSFGLNAKAQLEVSGGSPKIRRQLRGYVSCGESAGELLIRSLRGLVISMATEFAKRRLGSNWAAQETDDLIGDGILIALECCAGYDESRGTTVAQWVATQLRQHLHALDFSSGGGQIPREWKQVARAMHTLEQAADATTRSKTLYSSADVLDLLMQTEQKRHIAKGFSPEEAALRARDSLSRKSVLRAMRELSEISALRGGVVSIDKPTTEDGGVLSDMLPAESELDTQVALCSDADALHAVMDVMPAAAVAKATERYGSAGEDVSYRRLADDTGANWLDIRHSVERVKAAPAAPHAQFCAFYPHIEGQIEMLPAVAAVISDRIDAAAVKNLLLAGR